MNRHYFTIELLRRKVAFRRISQVLTCLGFLASSCLVSANATLAIEGAPPVGQEETPEWATVIFKKDQVLFIIDEEANCSGSLISPDYVLTAAHCVANLTFDAEEAEYLYRFQDPNETTVKLGFSKQDTAGVSAAIGRSEVQGSDGIARDIDAIEVHPLYGDEWMLGERVKCNDRDVAKSCKTLEYREPQYDLALLKLDRPVPSSTDFVELTSSVPTAGTDAIDFYGYGNTASGSKSEFLRRIPNGSYAFDPSCYPDQPYLVCSIANGGTNVTFGDSGGPWLNPNGQQYAVNSFTSQKRIPEREGTMLVATDLWLTNESGVLPKSQVDQADGSLATALIIDSSGSMRSTDPGNRRIDAGIAYLTASASTDLVGVVDFDDWVKVRSEPVNTQTKRGDLIAALRQIDSSGGTQIGDGIAAGCDLLQDAGGEKRAAILLTDGDGGFNGQDQCFVDAGWPIYTFGLGPWGCPRFG